MVIQHGAHEEVELCRVDNDPHGLARAAVEKTLRVSGPGHRMVRVAKYTSVRVVDHQADTA